MGKWVGRTLSLILLCFVLWSGMVLKVSITGNASVPTTVSIYQEWISKTELLGRAKFYVEADDWSPAFSLKNWTLKKLVFHQVQKPDHTGISAIKITNSVGFPLKVIRLKNSSKNQVGGELIKHTDSHGKYLVVNVGARKLLVCQLLFLLFGIGVTFLFGRVFSHGWNWLVRADERGTVARILQEEKGLWSQWSTQVCLITRSVAIRLPLLLLLPMLLALWAFNCSKGQGPFWLSRSDPEYLFLISGLNMAEGRGTHLTTHPGVPLQSALSVALPLIHHFDEAQRVSNRLAVDVFARSDRYLRICNIGLLVMFVGAQLILGCVVWSLTRSMGMVWLLQFGSFTAFISLFNLTRVSAEGTLMILGPLLSAGLVAMTSLRGGARSIILALTLAFFCAFGVATKTVFAPLCLVLLGLEGWRRRLVALLALVGFYLVLTAPIIPEYQRMFSWWSHLATHAGRYGDGVAAAGGGGERWVTLNEVVSREWVYFSLEGGVILVAVWAWLTRRIQGQTVAARLFVLLEIASLLIFLLSLKQPSAHYLTSFVTLFGAKLFILGQMIRLVFKPNAVLSKILLVGLVIGFGTVAALQAVQLKSEAKDITAHWWDCKKEMDQYARQFLPNRAKVVCTLGVVQVESALTFGRMRSDPSFKYEPYNEGMRLVGRNGLGYDARYGVIDYSGEPLEFQDLLPLANSGLLYLRRPLLMPDSHFARLEKLGLTRKGVYSGSYECLEALIPQLSSSER